MSNTCFLIFSGQKTNHYNLSALLRLSVLSSYKLNMHHVSGLFYFYYPPLCLNSKKNKSILFSTKFQKKKKKKLALEIYPE